MAKYKVKFRIAKYYGQPDYFWKEETEKLNIAGPPTYGAKQAILRKRNLTPNHGIQILNIHQHSRVKTLLHF